MKTSAAAAAAVLATASLAGGTLLFARHRKERLARQGSDNRSKPAGTASPLRPRRGSLPDTVDDAMRAELNEVLFETNLYEAFSKLLHLARRVVGAESAVLYVVDPMEASLHIAFTSSESGEYPAAATKKGSSSRTPLGVQSITTFVATVNCFSFTASQL